MAQVMVSLNTGQIFIEFHTGEVVCLDCIVMAKVSAMNGQLCLHIKSLGGHELIVHGVDIDRFYAVLREYTQFIPFPYVEPVELEGVENVDV